MSLAFLRLTQLKLSVKPSIDGRSARLSESVDNAALIERDKRSPQTMKRDHLAYGMFLASSLIVAGCGKDAHMPITLSIGTNTPATTAAAERSNIGDDDDTDTERASEDLSDEPIVVRFELADKAFNVEKSIRVTLRNNTDQPIRIWDPEVEPGENQCSFHFTNVTTGECFVARKRASENRGDWRKLYGDRAITEIAPGDDIRLSMDVEWKWTGLPCPNSNNRFSISLQFESIASRDSVQESLWTGKIQCTPVEATLIAPTWSSPHQYLQHGFPEKAIELMAADPRWITTNDDFWRKPLHCAASYGHPSAVRWLLDHGADVNDTATNAFTPLHLTRNPQVIAMILETKPDWSGMRETPLQCAAAQFARHDSPKEKEKWRNIVEVYLKADVDYDLITAIHLDDRERVTEILLESPHLADECQGQSPLRAAAALGRLDICGDLIDRYHVDVNDFQRGAGYPIIKEALQFPSVVKLLIDHGADVKTRIMFQGVKVGASLIDDEATVLHYAAHHGVSETMTLLIEAGVDIFAKTKGRAQTALELSAMSGDVDKVRAIVQHPMFATVDLALRQSMLDKSLWVAATFPAEGEKPNRLLKLLVEHGANPNVNEGDRPLIQAVASSRHSRDDRRRRIDFLLEHGGSLDFVSAIAIGDLETVRRLLDQEAASVNPRDEGYPCLTTAVELNDMEIVKELLKAGFDINIGNQSAYRGALGETPLHCAVAYQQYEMVEFLLNSDADVNALDDEENAPLHRWGNSKIARLLLARGARLDTRNAYGDTLLDLSRKSQRGARAEVDKLFRQFGNAHTD